MRLFVLCFGASVACGSDRVPPDPNSPDAPPPGTPIVTVTAPSKASAFYVTQTVAIDWMVEDDGPSVRCEVTADNGGAPISIASGVVTASGSSAMASWQPVGVTPATDYEVKVACTDSSSPPLTGIGVSGPITLSPPPQPVDFTTQVLPILTSTCTDAQCHDSVQPQESLDLTAAKAYGSLVGVASKQCPSTKRVQSGDPNASYIMIKLQGSGGSCFIGTKMPKPPNTITPTQIQQIRDWIFNGAPS